MILLRRGRRQVADGVSTVLLVLAVATSSSRGDEAPSGRASLGVEDERQIATAILRAASETSALLLVLAPDGDPGDCNLDGPVFSPATLRPDELAGLSAAGAPAHELGAETWRAACTALADCRSVPSEEVEALTTDGDSDPLNDWRRLDEKHGYRFAMRPTKVRVVRDVAVGCAHLTRGWPTGQNWVYVLRRRAGGWALVEAVRDDSIVY